MKPEVKKTQAVAVPVNLEDRIFVELDRIYPIALKKGMGVVQKDAAAVQRLTAQILNLPEDSSREEKERKGRFTGEILSPIAQGQFSALLAQLAFPPTAKMGSDRGDERSVTYHEFSVQLEQLVKVVGPIPATEGFNRFSIRKLIEKYDRGEKAPQTLVGRAAAHNRRDAFWAIRLWLDAKPKSGSQRPSHFQRGGRFQKPADRSDNRQQGRVSAAQRELERQKHEEFQRVHKPSAAFAPCSRVQFTWKGTDETGEVIALEDGTARVRKDSDSKIARVTLEKLSLEVIETEEPEEIEIEEEEEELEPENGAAPTVEWAASVCEIADTFRKPLRKELKRALKVWGAGSGEQNDSQFVAAVQAVMERAKTEQ